MKRARATAARADAPAPSAGGAPGLAVLLALALVLVLGVVFAFGGARENAFVLLDDHGYLVENPVVRDGLTARGVAWAFTTFEQSNWHPLTWLAHMLAVELFGLDPAAHHTFALALHAVSALLVFALLVRWHARPFAAFAVAAFFAWHPLRVESVAWAAELKDVLSVLCGLLALHAWTSWIRGPRRRDAVLAHAAFAASLLAKPTLVTFPFLLAVLDVWPFARTRAVPVRALVREKLGFLALALASCVVTYVAQSAGGSVVSATEVGIAVRASNALVSVLTYVVQSVWPAGLSVWYPHPQGIDGAALAAACAFVVTAGVVAWRARTSAPAVACGLAWFAGSLVPMLGLVQVGGQAHADRYTYWPSIGLGIAIVFGVAALLERKPVALRAAGAAGILALAAFAVRARAQTAVWRDTRTLCEHAQRTAGDAPLMRLLLGQAALAREDFTEAVEQLQACIALDERFLEALNALATAYVALGRTDDARACLERAIALGRDGANVRANLGVLARGRGDFADSRAQFERALALDPGHLQAHLGLGRTLQASGDHAGALAQFAAARALAPRDVDTLRAFSTAALVLGREAEAAEASTRLLEVAPGDVGALLGLAWLRALAADPALRDPRASLALAERALQLARTDDAQLHDVLAAARAANGDFTGAAAEAARAIELYRRAGRPDAARRVEQRAAEYSGAPR